MHPILLRIGFISIKTYGLFLSLAFIAGYFLLIYKARKKFWLLEEVNKLFLWIIISGIAGARIFYILMEEGMDWKNPLAILRVWEGGLHYFGGLTGGILAVVAFRLRHPSFKIWQFADIVAPSIALGLSIGKLGCFSAGCCYGLPTNLPWGVEFNHPDSLAIRGILLHPVQLYESLIYAVIFFIVERLYYKWKSRREGELFCWSVLLLSSARFVFEFLRWDAEVFLHLHTGGVISLIFVILSSGAIFLIRKNNFTTQK